MNEYPSEFIEEILDCVSEMTDMQAARLVDIATNYSVPLPELLGVLTVRGSLEVAKYIKDNFMSHVGSRGFDYSNLIK